MSLEFSRPLGSALVVWSDYREMGARLPLLFHQAGIAVDILGVDHPVLTLSRHIRCTIHCERAAIPGVLRSHLAQATYDWIVLGDEATLYALIDDPAGGWDGVFPVESSGGKPHLITSKAAFTHLCQSNDVPMPLSVICERPDEIAEAAAELGFPVVVKTDRGCAGNGVRVVKSTDALPTAMEQLGLEHSRGPWIVQKFVEGRTGSTQLLLDHGRPVCWFASFKHTTYPPPHGPSCVRELFEHPDMAARLEQIGSLTGFHGLCGVDWMVDDSQTLFILELNARPTPCSHLGPFAGVDFSLALRQITTGGPVSVQAPPPLRKKTLIFMWPQYGYYCLRYGRLTGLLRFLPGAAHTDFFLGEPHVLRYNLFHFLRESARHFKHQTLRRSHLWP